MWRLFKGTLQVCDWSANVALVSAYLALHYPAHVKDILVLQPGYLGSRSTFGFKNESEPDKCESCKPHKSGNTPRDQGEA